MFFRRKNIRPYEKASVIGERRFLVPKGTQNQGGPGRPGPLASRVGESISGTGTSRNLSRGSATLVGINAEVSFTPVFNVI